WPAGLSRSSRSPGPRPPGQPRRPGPQASPGAPAPRPTPPPGAPGFPRGPGPPRRGAGGAPRGPGPAPAAAGGRAGLRARRGDRLLQRGAARGRAEAQESGTPAKTIGRFSVISTQDELTLAAPHCLRFSAPPDVYLDELPSSPDMKAAVRRVQTASSVDVLCDQASSDSADEPCPRQPAPAAAAQLSPPSSSTATDLIKKAAAFLQRSAKGGSPGPESPNGQGAKIPTINITSFHSQSSYMSSDNDSEFEDADMKKELQNLREKHMKEIAELQTQQKNEIEALYIRLGKPLPPNLGFLHSAPPSSRRRRTSKNKLKAGKLLNPLVQQLRSGTSSTSRYTGCLPLPVACVSRGCAV
uniref:WNK lysine deficient protein kinase 2 n=1 Tax=Zonotrichia albicollis TaxID=44394 RepID=A0A8D2M924_ZONAL